jgi:hypothetical protein
MASNLPRGGSAVDGGEGRGFGSGIEARKTRCFLKKRTKKLLAIWLGFL